MEKINHVFVLQRLLLLLTVFSMFEQMLKHTVGDCQMGGKVVLEVPLSKF